MGRMSRARLCFIGLLVVASACSDADPRTEIIVAVDTDLVIPGELDAVRIEMLGPSGQVRRSMGLLSGTDSLPATVGMVHTGGPLGPVQVTVVGQRGGSDVVEREASVSFVQGRTLILRILLARECIGVTCPAMQTCAPGGCRSVNVPASELESYDGSIGRADAGGDGGCPSSTETCNGMDDDCDGTTDEGFDLMTDDDNCGACGNACPASPTHGSSSCTAGSCVLSCDMGYADCDMDADTGCEALLSTAATCGDCGTVCEDPSPLCDGNPTDGYSCVSSCPAGTTECGTACVNLMTDPSNCGSCDMTCSAGGHASGSCDAGSCGMVCDADWEDCDGDMTNGCETSLTTLMNCGSCGTVCSLTNGMESCATGSCTLVGCDMGFDDCDSDMTNGCETNVASGVMNCGMCGNACPASPANASPVCAMGSCDITCDAGFGDCNTMAGDGCEQSFADTANCGACGNACSGTTPVCGGSAGSYLCVESCTAPSMICGTVCTDVVTDASNCGSCGMVCSSAMNASANCMSSSCGITCDAGFGDCNTMTGDGCETDLTTVTNCGTCGTPCSPSNATGSCSTGSCAIGTCNVGFLDCDMDVTTGCEQSSNDMNNCGACGAICPAAPPNTTSSTCSMSACRLVCTSGFGNCDGDATNGCEAPLTTLTDCGSCGNACTLANATTSCATGTCELSTCNPGFGNCDGNAGNGCEVDLSSDRRHCGVCDMNCGGGNRCCSGVCMPGGSCP